MKFKTGLLLSWAVLSCTSTLVQAAASDDEAKRLTGVFQTYLSTTEGVVSVTPDGDAYKVKLDLQPLAAAGATEAKVSITPLEFSLVGQGDGKWQVTQDQAFSLSADAEGKGSVEEKIGSLKASGVFDEKLGTFANLTGDMTDISVTEKIVDPAAGAANVSATIKSMKMEQTATASGDSAVDLSTKITLDGLVEDLDMPASAAGGMPVKLVINAPTGTLELNGKGLKARPILDLVSFFVSHQSKELVVKDQAALKTILSAGLPVWDNLQETGKINDVKVTSSVGEISFESVDIAVDANGAVADGKFRESISMNGMTLPAAIVPPWATALVPKNFSFDFAVSGFDLAAPAKMALEALDLSKDNPLPEGFEQTMMPAFMPKGTVDITLNPTILSNDSYNVKVEGSMTAGPAAMPTGKATVTAKGLDEIMKVVQAAPPEAGLGQGLAMIIAAKGIGKAAADGALTWDIESTPDGKITINGIDPNTLGKP